MYFYQFCSWTRIFFQTFILYKVLGLILYLLRSETIIFVFRNALKLQSWESTGRLCLLSGHRCIAKAEKLRNPQNSLFQMGLILLAFSKTPVLWCVSHFLEMVTSWKLPSLGILGVCRLFKFLLLNMHTKYLETLGYLKSLLVEPFFK